MLIVKTLRLRPSILILETESLVNFTSFTRLPPFLDFRLTHSRVVPSDTDSPQLHTLFFYIPYSSIKHSERRSGRRGRGAGEGAHEYGDSYNYYNSYNSSINEGTDEAADLAE